MKTHILRVAPYILLISCLLTSSCKDSVEVQAEVPIHYNLLSLKSVSKSLSRNYTASIQGRQDIHIYPHVSGFITKLLVDEGSSVKKGDILFIIDQIPYIAALNTANADVEVAKANVATAELMLRSRKELFANKVISEFDFQMAQNGLITAKALLVQADAKLMNAENELSYTIIKAPCNGVLGTLPYRVGSLVSATISKPLTTISDNSEMYVYFSITEKQLLAIVRDHQSIDSALVSMPALELNLSDGSTYKHKGRIESISGVIDAKTGTVSLRASFPNPGRLLHSGGAGVVNIPYTKTQCLTIPQEASFEIQDKIFVYRIVDGLAKSTMITVFPEHDGKEYIVESGLKAGDTILLNGVAMMKDGTPIKQ